MNTDVIAENYGGETEQFLAGTAREFGVCLLAGAAMRGRDGRVRNKALVFSPAGELMAFYAKMQPFTLGGERQHYMPGEKISVFQWAECTVAPFICYDLRFPELFRRAAAAHRPELFVVIASWPEKRIHHWTRLLQARAIENQAFVIGVNRTGRDPNYNHTGRSIIVDFHGEPLSEIGAEEGNVRARLDLAALREYRRSVPFLDDLRG
jgi:predicted amidohydrolase